MTIPQRASSIFQKIRSLGPEKEKVFWDNVRDRKMLAYQQLYGLIEEQMIAPVKEAESVQKRMIDYQARMFVSDFALRIADEAAGFLSQEISIPEYVKRAWNCMLDLMLCVRHEQLSEIDLAKLKMLHDHFFPEEKDLPLSEWTRIYDYLPEPDEDRSKTSETIAPNDSQAAKCCENPSGVESSSNSSNTI